MKKTIVVKQEVEIELCDFCEKELPKRSISMTEERDVTHIGVHVLHDACVAEVVERALNVVK